MEAIELNEKLYKASIADITNSKSCYIEITPTQKFGESKENTPLLLGKKGYGSTSKSSSFFGNSSVDDEESYDSNKKKNIAQSVFNAKLLAIGILLVAGCSIALYLLAVETHIPNGFALDLVGRDVWSKIPFTPIGALLNSTTISTILFLQTGGTECLDPDSCMSMLRKMQILENQIKNSAIPYNFLIGSDGQTYEIRGWDYANGFQFVPKETSLAIGFIGNYTLKSPSVNQLRSASSLINETKRKQKLNDPFQIYGVRNLTVSHSEGDALFKKLSMWPEFDTLLKIL